MRISRTRFRDFRNFEKLAAEWGPGINLLTGPNGSGKTNVLEALHLLTGWGGMNGAKTGEMIRWGAERASLAAQFEGKRSAVAEAALSSRASLRLDGKVCRWGDLRLCVQSLAFLPSDMALVEGSPAVRRRFLDVLCALFFPLYAWKLSEYRRIVRHKRYLLGKGHSPSVTHRPMSELASWIWACRSEAVGALQKHLQEWKDLQPRETTLELKRGGGGVRNDFAEDFDASCALMEARERSSGLPLVGPHRDELAILCEGMPAGSVFSRGQRRRAALALILAAASAVEARFRASPVLLLDEVTAELDSWGRDILFRCLERSGWQVFAATAEESVPAFKGTLWNVRSGTIEKISEPSASEQIFSDSVEKKRYKNE